MDTVLETHAETHTTPGPLRVCDYVDRDFEAVIGALHAAGPELLTRALTRAVTAVGSGRTQVKVRMVEPPAPASADVARAHLAWSATSAASEPAAGEATLTVIVVQSGADPRTELLLTIGLGTADREEASHVGRRFLEELTADLARVASAAPQSSTANA